MGTDGGWKWKMRRDRSNSTRPAHLSGHGCSRWNNNDQEETMEDPVDIRRRMQRLVERVDRRDDYGRLLADGHVMVTEEDVEDPEAWRAAIRRQARADRIRVQTARDVGVVWAVLKDLSSPARRSEMSRYNRALGMVVPHAVGHRHEPVVVLRDGDEALFACERCSAYGYARTSDEAVFGGELFERDCPHDSPPRATALSFFAGAS
jgi:hypothetical protein